MARPDQGVFHRFQKKYKELKHEYDEEIDGYAQPPEDNDFFSGLALTSGSLFDRLEEMEKEVGGMLTTLKFEEEKNRKSYENMQTDLRSMADDLQHEFKKRCDLFALGCDGLMDIEKRTIDKLRINLS